MGRGGDLTGAQWERLEPLLPVGHGRCGRLRDHRRVVSGVPYRIRTGVQWGDPPDRYGPWGTVHERHRRWSADAAGEIDWDVSADSASVRAHRHAARTAPACQRALDSGGRDRSDPGRPGRPAGGGGAGGEALGRSRGGLTTKVHRSADGRCRVLSLVLTPGQGVDCTRFEAVMARIRVPRLTVGRTRTTPAGVSADKGYGNRRTRSRLGGRGIRYVIPEKADQAAGRLRRGRVGGRPPGFDEERYEKRYTVERAINKLRQFRAVATRYDKGAYVYLGSLTAAALVIRHRS
ncbi:IS5 family transposase [Kitasatospora sp. NPDC096147]|uniref:IS5 family transposase n=1 Tax=Kitasatospora sp. NPDC096147 TaxID=3364093 RepID=UPI00382D3F64